MTNREKTIMKIENQKEKMEEDNQTFGRISVFDRLELEYLQNVLKDLEILELLKSKIGICEDIDIRNLDFGLYFHPMTKEERDKIKEWLENGNNNK